MRSPRKLRQRMTVVFVVLCAMSGAGWALSSQAFAGAAARTAAATTPTPTSPRTMMVPKGMTMSTASATPMTTATNAHCGQVITASLTLNGDLDCSGYNGWALTVAGTTAVTLNFNGHTIYGGGGSTSTVCVVITGTSDIVENGIANGCEYGVALDRSKTTTVTKMVVLGATAVGIVENGTADKVTANTVIDDGQTGIEVGWQSSGTTISGNHSAGNTDGMEVNGSGTIVSSNALDDNASTGLNVLGGGGDTISGNSADSNGNLGIAISNYGVAITDGGGNTAHGNWYSSYGTAGPQCVNITCS